jgi:hypothetical protein
LIGPEDGDGRRQFINFPHVSPMELAGLSIPKFLHSRTQL